MERGRWETQRETQKGREGERYIVGVECGVRWGGVGKERKRKKGERDRERERQSERRRSE
jgi:hypothetical protein